MLTRVRNTLVLILVALTIEASASPAVGLVDINTAGNFDIGFARLGDDSALLQDRYLVFSASDELFGGVYGQEPWVHDLQTGQTQLLADIYRGWPPAARQIS